MKMVFKSMAMICLLGLFMVPAYGIDGGQMPQIQPKAPSDLDTSLHGTARGMRMFFEREDGFGPYSGINYDDIGCKDCHVESGDCAICHGDFTSNKEDQIDTCGQCHGRQNKEKAMGLRGLHMAEKGMVCSSCHKGDDVHGDGTIYQSMLEPGAIDAKCSNCHDSLSSNYSHDVHTGTLECSACHTKSVVTCYNCHFESMVDDHVKKPIKAIGNFVLLVNDERTGKITTGTYQSVSYQGKSFAIFAPFHGHSVMAEGRGCDDCHGNANMQMAQANGSIQLTEWENDTISHLEGAIPLMEETNLQFVDYDKASDSWSPTGIGPEQVQYGYCTPLTTEQIQMLQALPSSQVKQYEAYKK
ncbi:hypothetical protein GF373_05625 [bacterium]|nr:hypothetical protein [bacterium]